MAVSKGIKPTIIRGLNGMSNLLAPPAPLVDRSGKATPHFCVNCDVMDTGVVKQATGYSLAQSLDGLHSLAGEESGLSVMLGVRNGILYRIEPASGTMIPLASVGPKAQMTYAEVNQKVYCASAYWRGVYNLVTGAMEPWGLPVPDVAPDVTLVPGDLPPGRYSICYTRFASDSDCFYFGLMSGNGPIRTIEFQDQTRGLQLNNMADDFLVWMTQVNGGPLFLAEVETITTAPPLWPAGVAKPQHLWPFAQTGDYSDQGSVGGLPLTPVGPLTFNNGLVINGGGYAFTTTNPDVSNLGDIFSLIIKVRPKSLDLVTMEKYFALMTNWDPTYNIGYNIVFQSPVTVPPIPYPFISININQDVHNFEARFTADPVLVDNNNDYLIIVTFNNGVVSLHTYVNGIEPLSIMGITGNPLGVPNTGQGLYIGEYFDAPDGPLGDGSVISLAGVLKGKAWSATDVAAIQAVFGG